MENNEKQRDIFIWESNPEGNGKRHIVKIPVTQEVFVDYYHDIDLFRRKQQKHGRCVCPKSQQLLCDMDCGRCPYIAVGDQLSLNNTFVNEDGLETEYIEDLPSDEPDLDFNIAETELIHELHRQIESLTPDYKEICNLIMEGKTEREIGTIMSKDHKTIHYHKEKLFDMLREKLSEFIF